ncbi:MAG TPA: hypothetical protein VF532_10240 [Candidatus Angelobacter sp.]
MADTPKSSWDKAQIILAPVGGLFTALAVACVGFFGSRYINAQQEADTKQRVYAELMSKREEADVLLRKDMFNSIIGTFLTPKDPQQPNTDQVRQDVLKLELLAYNFHDSLDLGPLFKQVYKQIDEGKNFSSGAKQHRLDDQERAGYIERLEKVATVVSGKQISALRESGMEIDRAADLKEVETNPQGIVVYEGEVHLPAPDGPGSGVVDPDYRPRHMVLELLKADRKTKEIHVRLRIGALGSENINDAEVDKDFWVGFFDFPMIDNTRLSHDQRCAVVLKEFDAEAQFAEVAVVYFPGDRASLKEKPYYDEVLHSLRRTQEKVAREEK